MTKKYKVLPPLGTAILSDENFTEKELRVLAAQQIPDTEQQEVWEEKIDKDDIAEVIELLQGAGFEIEG